MAQYPLEALLNVRHYREGNAKQAVNKAREALSQAQIELENAIKARDDYRIWRIEEQDRRYDAIIGKECTLEDLENLKQDVAQLTLKEIEYEEECVKAEQRKKEREKELEEAKILLAEAKKETMKILAHKDIWKEEVKKEEARKEDLEMEEFKPKDTSDFEE